MRTSMTNLLLEGRKIILITSFELSPFVGLLRDTDLEYLLLLFLVVLGLRCCAGFSLVAASTGYCPVVVHRFLIVVVSHYRAQALGVYIQLLRHTGWVAPRHVGSSWTRDWTYVSLHWQVDSVPLSYQGSPQKYLLLNYSVLGEPEYTHNRILLFMKFLWIFFMVIWLSTKKGAECLGRSGRGCSFVPFGFTAT